MNNFINNQDLNNQIQSFLEEDGIFNNLVFLSALPKEKVHLSLKIKSDLRLAGLPFFWQVFTQLGCASSRPSFIEEWEGKDALKGQEFEFDLPFNVAILGERVALNLLHHTSSIATTTAMFVELAQPKNIKILDTRKTTPGLRKLEKYAVVLGGGHSHRYQYTDQWMIKDNHKKFFGGPKEAFDFYKNLKGFYTPIIAEVHSLIELEEAISFGCKHFLLDNFNSETLDQALLMKKTGLTYEVSGGINLDNLKNFLRPGVDALSVGMITKNPLPVDISLKIK